jgi:uncharacterized lipoprotein YbaY
MKISPMFFFAACAALLAGAGCSHLDVTPDGDPNRVITGTVNFRADIVLPSDAVVVVRVLDTAGVEQMRTAAAKDLPIMNQPKPEFVPEVLGEQTITAPVAGPVPFRIEYRADDNLVRHGLNVDARISYGGKVRFRTANAHVITPSNANNSHEVWVEPAGR